MTQPARQQQKPPPQPVTQPVPPSGYARAAIAAQAAAAIAALLAAVELAILAAIAAAIWRILSGTPQGLASRRLRSAIASIVIPARAQVSAILAKAAKDARSDVQRAITEDLGRLIALPPLVSLTSLTRVAGDLRNAQLEAAAAALREYKRITRHLASLPEAERLAEAQRLLDALAASGITAFTDKAGHHWGLATYAEAAVAGAIARAYTDMQTAAFLEAGIGLVIVVRSSPKPPCPRCAPYVGRVLALGHLTGTVTAQDAHGNLHTATVYGTVADAIAHGLLHPACKDSLAPFADGASLLGEIPHGPGWIAEQERRYRAEQDQRRRERALRIAQRHRAVALTPQARARARRLIRHLG